MRISESLLGFEYDRPFVFSGRNCEVAAVKHNGLGVGQIRRFGKDKPENSAVNRDVLHQLAVAYGRSAQLCLLKYTGRHIPGRFAAAESKQQNSYK